MKPWSSISAFFLFIPEVFTSCTKFYIIYVYIKTLHLKAYNKVTATDINNFCSSERRNIFNASRWLKFSNVTGYFTACIGGQSPTVKLDNTKWIRLRSSSLQRVSGTCGKASNSPDMSVNVSFKTHQGFKGTPNY